MTVFKYYVSTTSMFKKLMREQHYKRVSENIPVYLQFFERISYHESG